MPIPTEERPVRYFFISYNGLNPIDNKGVIGHLCFTSQGFPPLIWMTEQLVPNQSRVKIENVVITMFYEVANREDFDELCTGWDMNDQLNNFMQN